MLYLRQSQYAVASLAAAILISCVSSRPVEAAPEPGVCSGVLTKSQDRLVIVEEPEHICAFSGEAKRKILTVCAEGHYCEVEGILDDCKDSGECSEITSVISVRDLTLGKKQEQPPLPDMPPSGKQKDA